MMRFEYDQKFIKLLAKEMVKEMQKVKDEAKEPELITVKEAAETLNLSEDYVRKIKDKLPHVKQGNSKQGRILFVKEGLMDAYLNAVGKTSNAYQMNCASGACTNSLSVETTNFASRACKNEKLDKFSSKLV